MNLRSAAFAILAACAAVMPAAGQEPAPPPSTETPSPEAIAAARDFFQAVVFDNDLITIVSDGIGAQRMPEIRAGLLNSPLYRSASPERQAALVAFTESMPSLMRQEFTAEFTTVGERAAPRLAALMSAEELTQLAQFMRSPEMLAKWQAMFATYLESGEQQGAFPDWATDAEGRPAPFALTPAGVSFMREQATIERIFDEEFDLAVARMTPRLQVRIASGICTALGDECPPQLRVVAGGT